MLLLISMVNAKDIDTINEYSTECEVEEIDVTLFIRMYNKTIWSRPSDRFEFLSKVQLVNLQDVLRRVRRRS